MTKAHICLFAQIRIAVSNKKAANNLMELLKRRVTHERCDEHETTNGISQSNLCCLSLISAKLYAPGKGFQNVSFDLYPAALGIVGESGSGKSTLLKSLSGRQTPDSGEVIYLRGDADKQISQLEDLYQNMVRQRRHLLRTEVRKQHQWMVLRGRVSAAVTLVSV